MRFPEQEMLSAGLFKTGLNVVDRRRWVNAGVVLLAATLSVPLAIRRETAIAKLVDLAPRSERRIEPRLTGGFAWAAYAGAHRAASERKTADEMKLDGVVGEIVERAARDRSTDAQHAAGVALLLASDPIEAIARLETATDAKSRSDLAAARYAAASQLGRASLYPMALASADAALRIDPNLPEALFNRALILTRLGLTDDARTAWTAYLRADASSPWAEEARARLGELPAVTQASRFERNRPLLEAAAARGDVANVRRLVDADRERSRAIADVEVLGKWADAFQRNDTVEAARFLSIARRVGDALVELSGESLLHDAVAAIDRASSAEQHAIAAAQILYRDGRAEAKRGRHDVAARDLEQAASAFDALHDPMALEARHYAAGARLSRNDWAGARADYERLIVALDSHPGYLSLGGHARWQLARAISYDDDWAAVANAFAESAALFRRAGERDSEGFVETNLAFALTSLGRNDDAWAARIESFAALSAEGDSNRLITGITAAISAELSAGHRDAALSLAILSAAVAHGAPELVIDPLVNRALLQSMNGDAGGAMETVRHASAVAQTITDPEVRANCGAAVDRAAGAAALAAGDARAASVPLSRAVNFYASHAMPGALLDPLLLRARAAAQGGDASSAMRDLEQAIGIVESHPAGAPGVATGWSLLDAEHAIFTDAIRLSLDRGDNATAFAIAERSHGTPATLAELQHRLAGSGTAVLEIVALPDELVTFAVAANDVVVRRHPVPIERLASLADDVLTEQKPVAAGTLYDELIRPADAILDRAGEVVIVADRRLATVPFAALYDAQQRRFLVERMTVATASSAGSLHPDERPTQSPALAAVALPSGGSESAGLPDAENEVRDVAALYRHSVSVPAAEATYARFRTAVNGAGVVHVAGHTEQQRGAGEQALLFAGERVSWKTILASPPAAHGVIVLAACETLRPPSSAATHAISLGAAFSATGARDVIGTLAPVGDRDARRLFNALHRRLASGERAADALRAVQQEAIRNEISGGGTRAWRAVASLTTRIPAARRERSESWAN